MGVRSELGRVVRETWREVRDENVTFMAGSIAYYAFVSLLPLLVFALVVLAALDSAAFTARLSALTEAFLTPYARQLLVESLDASAARTGMSVVGALTLLWGMSRIFQGLDVAFSEIYDTRAEKSLLSTARNGVVVFLALGLAVAAFAVVGSVAAFAPDLPHPSVANPLLLVAGLAVAFVPVYYVFPDVDLTVREVLPGVVFAAVGWTALGVVFQGYVAYATRYETIYGTLGSAFVLLVWLYASGLVVLVGGVLNAVLAGRTGDEHALGVTDEVSADPTADGRGEPARDGAGLARDGDAPRDPDDLRRAYRRLDRAHEELGRAYERLDADRERVREEASRLAAENERLRRENDALTRRLARRRSVWARAKRLVAGERS
ncbi:YihY/virulence factor BrkB family protein [Halorussus halobius]|uniref:YihY/virulence factor BrkB family protein n=1 Tax=Halorussus halobius TaxID=1710537 RepID=UPI001092F63C|nr:YihY/virulence factor BrkB family protein [Halorussus halobius]